MGTHLWLKEDIRNILISARVTSEVTADCAPSPGTVMYLRGYRSALTAIAVACGISLEQIGFNSKSESGGDMSIADTELSLQGNIRSRRLAGTKFQEWE